MPQQWRLDLYRLSCAGATAEQLQQKFDLPAEEIALQLEAARLCFEKQCVVARLKNIENFGGAAQKSGPGGRSCRRIIDLA